jgi:hypothetical protein
MEGAPLRRSKKLSRGVPDRAEAPDCEKAPIPEFGARIPQEAGSRFFAARPKGFPQFRAPALLPT